MRISCDEAKLLMEKYFRNKTTPKEEAKIIKHCESCDVCKVLFYNLQDTNPNICESAFNTILSDNKDVTKRRKIRKRIIIISSIALVLIGLIITSFIFLQNGKVTYFANIDYGNTQTYFESTPEHPSYEEIKQATRLSKLYFREIGPGCILTSLRYNPDLTYNESKGYGDSIVIDFSYIRVYPVDGSTNSFFTNNDTLSFIYVPEQSITFEQTRGLKNEKN